MRTNRRTGTTLIEMLVVIVVFLVGILAVVQVFPPGLNILRTTANNTKAAQLGSAEMTRIQGKTASLPEMIVPVVYNITLSGTRVTIDTNRKLNDLMPRKDPGNAPGRIDANGEVLLAGGSIGNWQRVSGANLVSRVIGEGGQVPGPRRVPGLPVGNDFGGVMQLTFGPAYYFPTPQGVGQPGVVQVYGNDYSRRWGNRDFNNPNPFGRWREGEFFFVAGEDSDDVNFQGLDQIWVAPSASRNLRVQFAFAYNNQGRTEQYDIIVQATLDAANNTTDYALRVGNYWVISIPDLIDEADIYTGSTYVKANYLSVDFDSIRVQRIFDELPINAAFNANDPYQYKVIGTGYDAVRDEGFCLGTLLFNPGGFTAKVFDARGVAQKLLARVDYTVFDWRLIKDEFRVPTPEIVSGQLLPKQLKLTLNSLKTLSSTGPDNKVFKGTGLITPTLTPLNTGQTDDVIVEDLDTGAVILGNRPNDPSEPGFPQNPDSSWSVDKSYGQIIFRDADNDASNGLSAYMCFPTGDPNNPWNPRVLVPDITGRNIRVIYMAKGEWSVQPLKAARAYRVSAFLGTNGMGPGECLVGGTLDVNGVPIGQSYRLYFAPFELGQKVIAGEVWLNNGSQPFMLADQEFQISGIENVGGFDLAYADIRDKAPVGSVFDWTQGYAVRRVRGASLKVRVMWNPSTFFLTGDEVRNYNELEVWMRSWRRTETESLQVGGRN